MSLANALPVRSSGPTFTPLGLKKGLHPANFIGMGETYEKHDNFNGCRKCSTKGADGKWPIGPGCDACDGSGKLKAKYVLLKYAIGDTVETEEVSYKLSPPGQTKDGKTLSPSTLYSRMRTFFDKSEPSDLAAAYDAFEVAGTPLPVLLMVSDNKNFTHTKISSVMLPT